jgi:hypothetical protein
MLGLVYWNSGDFPNASENLQRSREMAEAKGDLFTHV